MSNPKQESLNLIGVGHWRLFHSFILINLIDLLTNSLLNPNSVIISSSLFLFSIYSIIILSNWSYSGRESLSFWLGLNSAEGGLVIVFQGIISVSLLSHLDTSHT